MYTGTKIIKQDIHLSPQEGAILQMLWDGLRNKEIAQAMGLSDKTVKNYKSNMYAKLGVTHCMQLARRAVELRLVPLGPEPICQEWPE